MNTRHHYMEQYINNRLTDNSSSLTDKIFISITVIIDDYRYTCRYINNIRHSLFKTYVKERKERYHRTSTRL